MTWTVSVHHVVQFVSAARYQRPGRVSWDKAGKGGVHSSSRVLTCQWFVNCPLTSLHELDVPVCPYLIYIRIHFSFPKWVVNNLRQGSQTALGISHHRFWGVSKNRFAVSGLNPCCPKMLGLGPNLLLFVRGHFVVNFNLLLLCPWIGVDNNYGRYLQHYMKRDVFIDTYRKCVQKTQTHQSRIGRAADGCNRGSEDNASSQIILERSEKKHYKNFLKFLNKRT